MKKLTIEGSIVKLAVLLLFGYPFVYISMKLTSNSNLIFIKEIIIGLMFVFILIDILSKKKVPSVFIKYFLIGVLSVFIALINYEDYVFFFIYYREFFVYPLIFIYIGVTYRSSKRNILMDIYYSLGFCVVLLLIFKVIYLQHSYGLTGRLTSFFSGEHAPAIVSLLYVLFYISMRRSSNLLRVDIATIIAGMALYVIILTDSRFALVSLLALLFLQIFVRTGKDKLVLIFLLLGGVTINYFLIDYGSLSVRGYDYNINARLEQYALARSLIEEHWFLGIGVDKYGKLGSLEKEIIFNGYSTITMDSTIIKYTVNTGIPLVLLWLYFLYSPLLIKERHSSNKAINIYIYLVVIACVVGIVTGKLGTFPFIFYFYVFFGFVCSNKKSSNRSGDVTV